MTARMGFQGKLFYRVGGVGSGSWVELANVRDVNINLSKSEGDATTRGNNGWKATLAGIKDGTVEFEMVWDTTEPGFGAIQTAWDTNAAIGIAAFDSESGAGWEFDAQVFDLSKSEPLEDAQTASVTIKPTFSDTPPAYVSSGGPTGGTST